MVSVTQAEEVSGFWQASILRLTVATTFDQERVQRKKSKYCAAASAQQWKYELNWL